MTASVQTSNPIDREHARHACGGMAFSMDEHAASLLGHSDSTVVTPLDREK